MKKILVFALVLTLALALAAPAFAEFKISTFKLEASFDYESDVMTVLLSAIELNEIYGMTAVLKFDADKMTYRTNPAPNRDMDIAAGLVQLNTGTPGQIRVVTAEGEALEMEGSNSFLRFTFEVPEANQTGTVTFTWEFENQAGGENGTEIIRDGFEVLTASHTFRGDNVEPSVEPSVQPSVAPSVQPSEGQPEPKCECTEECEECECEECECHKEVEPEPSKEPDKIPGKTGGAAMVSIAIISAVAGLGALTLRKKD